ncbi:hypothetical protein GCM10029964_032900 [Kibdelosporangium lantanae]
MNHGRTTARPGGGPAVAGGTAPAWRADRAAGVAELPGRPAVVAVTGILRADREGAEEALEIRLLEKVTWLDGDGRFHREDPDNTGADPTDPFSWVLRPGDEVKARVRYIRDGLEVSVPFAEDAAENIVLRSRLPE